VLPHSRKHSMSNTKTATRRTTNKPHRSRAANPRPQSPLKPSMELASPPAASSAKPLSKQSQLAALLVRDEGATLDEMIATTGWLPHSTRAALTGLKKKGYAISSDKVDGVRTYRAVAPE
ncbi:MAG: DUF3489 domain-containing protein, partial [Pseudomonadota bacterium]|nr:DUF3489 domain-containing protein [Pseudomonadota bacterium]